jgi:predicted ABC-type ATPase
MDNLLSHLSLIDHLIVIDNSSADGVIVLEATGETIRHHVATLPDWVQVIACHLQNKITDH